MKQFFKMTLATICGIAIFLLITLLFFVISFAGMLASDTASTKVKENSVFVPCRSSLPGLHPKIRHQQ